MDTAGSACRSCRIKLQTVNPPPPGMHMGIAGWLRSWITQMCFLDTGHVERWSGNGKWLRMNSGINYVTFEPLPHQFNYRMVTSSRCHRRLSPLFIHSWPRRIENWNIFMLTKSPIAHTDSPVFYRCFVGVLSLSEVEKYRPRFRFWLFSVLY